MQKKIMNATVKYARVQANEMRKEYGSVAKHFGQMIVYRAH